MSQIWGKGTLYPDFSILGMYKEMFLWDKTD